MWRETLEKENLQTFLDTSVYFGQTEDEYSRRWKRGDEEGLV